MKTDIKINKKHCSLWSMQKYFSGLRVMCILEQVTINRRLLIGRDGHLDQSEAYDLS